MNRLIFRKCHKNVINRGDRGNCGFTIIEVIISITLFIYIFGAIIFVYIMFNKNILHDQKNASCPSFAKIIIQNLLTNSDFFEIGTSTSELYFKYFNKIEYEIVVAEDGDLYLRKSTDLPVFSTSSSSYIDSKKQFQFGNCSANKIFFQKSIPTPVVYPNILNKSKCVDLIRLDYRGATSSVENICAFF